MKVPNFDNETAQREELINSKITLPGEKLLPHPLSLKFIGPMTSLMKQTSGFLIIIITWLEKMAMTRIVYGRIKAFRAFAYIYSVDGHVEDLKYHNISDNQIGYCYFQFKVKPTERSKTEDRKDFYWGFIVLENSGSIYSAYCACNGG